MEKRDENLAETFAYLKDVLGVRYLAQPDSLLESLATIAKELEGCARCKLSRGRKNIVFGAGNLNAELMFIGEGPGEQEDLSGEPFVGEAGKLLTKMIEAMQLTRDKVYIANIVKCRPPLNRNPESDEIEQCRPFLERQLKAVNPRVVVLLGTFAAQSVLKTEDTVSRLRGKFIEQDSRKLMVTYHPAYLLRNPAQKKTAWADLQLVMSELKLKAR